MKKIIWTIVLIVGFIFLWNAFSFYSDLHALPKEPIEGEFVIESGQHISDIAQHLEEQGYIVDASTFVNYAKFRNIDHLIKAGSYDLTSDSIANMVNILVIGPEREEVVLRFLEGWTNHEMQEYLVNEGIIQAGDFDLAIEEILDDEKILENYPFITQEAMDVNLEGFLFPDTYRFFKGVQAKEIIVEMLDTFEEKVGEDVLLAIRKKSESYYDIIRIASILEREVQYLTDKKQVADIIYKRLEIGMPLQMDSTVNYVTGNGRSRILYTERDIDSPYNTYKYKGLPSGPISNPGLDSILAAVYPASNNYYYFLTDPVGNVYYAASHDGHLANRQYLD